MKIFLLIFAVLTAVLLALLLIPIRLEIDYKKDAVTNKVTVYLKYLFWKLCLYKDKDKNKTKSKNKKQSEKPKEPFSFSREKERIEGYIKAFDSIKDDAGRILDYAASKAAVFDNVEVETEFGFEDAMHTGIFTGILNGFVYSVLGFIHHRSNLKKMNVNIQPVFGKICFDLHIRCILHLKNVHIIVVAVNVLRLLRKLKKSERGN